MVNKLVIACLVLILFSAGLMLYGDDIKILHPYFLTGSGDAEFGWQGRVNLQIDSTADSSGARFYTEQIATDFKGMEVLYGFFEWYSSGPSTIDGDSAFPADSMVVKLQTGLFGPTSGYSWNIRTDSIYVFDTLYYELANTDDTLFKSNTWFEFDIWDSTSDSTNADTDGSLYLRNYNIKAGLEAR